MRSSAAAALLLACGWGPLAASAGATCTEVALPGPFAPRRLMKCVGGMRIYRSTDPNSCPAGWKIFAPESREDWDTVIKSGVLPVRNPHFIVDITRPENGCGSGCRKTMNSDNAQVQSWKTMNGEKWWLRNSPYGEPNGDYTKNCYLSVNTPTSPDHITFNDGSCSFHSTDYLCQPASKVDCTNRTDEITGPCKSEKAIFRHSNCTAGVCEQGKYLLFKSATTIEECKKICDDGRVYTPAATGLEEKVYYFRQNGRYHDVSTRTPDMTRTVETINYRSTLGNFPGFSQRDHFYIRWTGNLRIRAAGRYTFYTQSDDGSRLSINGDWVVDNPGWHGMRTRYGHRTLAAGTYPIVVESFEGGIGAGMIAHWSGPDTGNSKKLFTKDQFVSAGGASFVLPGPFQESGPCMAYSMNSDKRCVIYTDCKGVGMGSTCDASLGILGDLTSFKTCEYPPAQVPSTSRL